MQVVAERCCGLDVHQGSVVACLLVGESGKAVRKEVRKFSTFKSDLLELKSWLLEQRCTHVAMESTGVYWQPVHAVLDGVFDVIVGNAQHMKTVPGRKTDVKDSEWIASLLRHGLIAKSFVPPKPIRELRDILRYRRKLLESRSGERNRLLKLIESANVKLASVATDVFGVSGMRMLKAILAGDSSPDQMAELAKGRLRNKRSELRLALDGNIEEHHRFLLRFQLRRLEQLDEDVVQIDARLDSLLKAYAAQVDLLVTIPGVDRITAATIIAELGVDMRVFVDAEHAASWAGVCPGNNESAGRQHNGQVRKGNVQLKTALVQAANAAGRAKGTYLHNKFHRLKARRGYKRATMAIAHKILVSAYHMLAIGEAYRDLGDDYLDRLSKQRTTTNLVRRLERLGYKVNLEDQEATQAIA
jgi:transposase